MKKFFYISIVLLISLICLSSCNDAGGLFNGARNASKLSNDIILGILDVSTSNNDITFNSNLYGVQTVSGNVEDDFDYSKNEIKETLTTKKVRNSYWFTDVAKVDSGYYAKLFKPSKDEFKIAKGSNQEGKIEFDTVVQINSTDVKFSCLTENGYALTVDKEDETKDNLCYLISQTPTQINVQYNSEPLTLTNLLSSTGPRINTTTGYFLGSDGSYCYVVIDNSNNGTATKCLYNNEGTEESIDAVCLSLSNDGTNNIFILDDEGYIYKMTNTTFTKQNTTSLLDTEIPSTAKFTGMIASKDNTFWISTKKNGIYKVTFDGDTPTVTRVY